MKDLAAAEASAGRRVDAIERLARREGSRMPPSGIRNARFEVAERQGEGVSPNCRSILLAPAWMGRG